MSAVNNQQANNPIYNQHNQQANNPIYHGYLAGPHSVVNQVSQVAKKELQIREDMRMDRIKHRYPNEVTLEEGDSPFVKIYLAIHSRPLDIESLNKIIADTDVDPELIAEAALRAADNKFRSSSEESIPYFLQVAQNPSAQDYQRQIAEVHLLCFEKSTMKDSDKEAFLLKFLRDPLMDSYKQIAKEALALHYYRSNRMEECVNLLKQVYAQVQDSPIFQIKYEIAKAFIEGRGQKQIDAGWAVEWIDEFLRRNDPVINAHEKPLVAWTEEESQLLYKAALRLQGDPLKGNEIIQDKEYRPLDQKEDRVWTFTERNRYGFLRDCFKGIIKRSSSEKIKTDATSALEHVTLLLQKVLLIEKMAIEDQIRKSPLDCLLKERKDNIEQYLYNLEKEHPITPSQGCVIS